MDINGCHIRVTWNAGSVEGFDYVCERYVGLSRIPNPLPEGAVKVERGPFETQREAVLYAQSWIDAEKPPEMPAVAKTVAESQVVEVPATDTNPQIAEPKPELGTTEAAE